MSFIAGMLIGLVLPKSVRYLRDNPDTVRGGIQRLRGMFSK
jgi:hypothetical protein